MQKIKLNVEGMSCQMCVKHVTKALADLKGVTEVKVSLETNSADVNFDPTVVGMADFTAAVAEAGYQVTGKA